MIYIATNCDKKFYDNKPNNVITTLLKYKRDDIKIMFFQIDFDESIEGVINVPIKLSDIKHSLRTDVINRPFYMCLESGEFTKFYDFNDDDILILIDYDVIQQRDFSKQEIQILKDLNDDEMYLTRNEFTEEKNSNDELDIVCMDRTIMEGEKPFKMYNCGCQIAKISTWKKLYTEWIKIYSEWEEKCKHHATGQLTINYILHKNNMLKELNPSFHSAWFMHGLRHFTRDRKFYIVDDEQMVLFNHHAWHNDFV